MVREAEGFAYRCCVDVLSVVPPPPFLCVLYTFPLHDVVLKDGRRQTWSGRLLL